MYFMLLKKLLFFKSLLNKHVCNRKLNGLVLWTFFIISFRRHEIIWQNYKAVRRRYYYHPLKQYLEEGHVATKVMSDFHNAKDIFLRRLFNGMNHLARYAIVYKLVFYTNIVYKKKIPFWPHTSLHLSKNFESVKAACRQTGLLDIRSVSLSGLALLQITLYLHPTSTLFSTGSEVLGILPLLIFTISTAFLVIVVKLIYPPAPSHI